MLTLRRSDERGHANHGWLDSRFSFSFAEYHDPQHTGFGSLRVINEDWIAPDAGFPMHPHRNMEIISYVLEGSIEHRDSAGHGAILKPDEVQYMRAGRGIQHSEFNPSRTDPLHLLQIWIIPTQTGGEPAYEQRPIPRDTRRNRLCTIASIDGRDGSIQIGADAVVYASILSPGVTLTIEPGANRRRVWLQLAKGAVTVNGTALAAGDGVALKDESATIAGVGDESEFVAFELA